jgi:GNAT superfamily N-acetyltransferase
VNVVFPAGARVAYDSATHNADIHQQVWLLEGRMDISVGDDLWQLDSGDCLAMRLDRPITYHNPDLPDNQPHRADVAKMLVHRRARRSGLAQALMHAIDEAACAEGKSVLVLDTVTGGDAERLYRRAGWQEAGSVPKYALMPDGAWCATTFFYKHL